MDGCSLRMCCALPCSPNSQPLESVRLATHCISANTCAMKMMHTTMHIYVFVCVCACVFLQLIYATTRSGAIHLVCSIYSSRSWRCAHTRNFQWCMVLSAAIGNTCIGYSIDCSKSWSITNKYLRLNKTVYISKSRYFRELFNLTILLHRNNYYDWCDRHAKLSPLKREP